MKKQLSIPEQVKIALDGRTQRWLSKEVGIAETDLSAKMKGKLKFTDKEIKSINTRLKSNINRP